MSVDPAASAEALWQQLCDAGLARHAPERWSLLAGLREKAGSANGALRGVLWQRFHWHAQEVLARLGGDCAVGTLQADAIQEGRSAMAGLLAQLEDATDGSHVLKAVEGLRDTWARRDMETRVSVAIETLPDDCGPLNSRALVTRSLKTMEELSPAYLERFVNYVDTLLWLQAASARGVKAESAETGKKPVRSRGRGGR